MTIRTTLLAAAAFVFAALAASVSHAAAPEAVDLALVLATDVSPSIDYSEAHLQREGVAEAFLNPQVVEAIQSGSLGKIAVAAIDFSSREYNKIVMNWRIIHDKATATAFGEAMRKAPTNTGRHTSISDGIELAELLFETSNLEATKKVIDVSGDGPNNWGRPMNVVRDEALAKGIVINGLPILGSAPDLDSYYQNCVIGGRGSFVVVASGFDDFARAIRQKLIQEIASAAPAKARVVKVQAAPLPRGGFSPPINEKGCENQFGGFGPFNGFDFPPPGLNLR